MGLEPGAVGVDGGGGPGLGDRDGPLAVGASRVGDVIELAVGGVDGSDRPAELQEQLAQFGLLQRAQAADPDRPRTIAELLEHRLQPGLQRRRLRIAQVGIGVEDPVLAAGEFLRAPTPEP